VKPLLNLGRVGGFEEQSQCLDEIDAGSPQAVALARYVEFGAEGHVPVSLALDDMVDEQSERMWVFEAGLS
jgi:hypothetical protein